MSNTGRLFDAIRQFQMARSAARSEYLNRMKEYADDVGTSFYQRKQDEAMKKRTATVEAAKVEAAREIDDALAAMRKAIRERKMEAPTPEQLAILQVLQMREHVSKAELDTAANSMGGNGLCLALVNEIARKCEKKRMTVRGSEIPQEFYGDYMKQATKGMAPADALNAVGELEKWCRAELNDAVGANKVRERSYRLNREKHGGPTESVDWETATASVHGKRLKPVTIAELDDLPQAAVYQSEQEFFKDVSSVPYDVITRTFNN